MPALQVYSIQQVKTNMSAREQNGHRDEHDACSAVKNKTKQNKTKTNKSVLFRHSASRCICISRAKNKNVVWMRLRSVGLDFRTEWHVGVEVVGCDVEMVLSALEGG